MCLPEPVSWRCSCAWGWLSHQSFVNKVFLPTPETVWQTALSFLREENFYIDVRVSVFRVTAGFLMAAAAALPIGVCIGSFKVMEGLLQPLTEFIRYIPVPGAHSDAHAPLWNRERGENHAHLRWHIFPTGAHGGR